MLQPQTLAKAKEAMRGFRAQDPRAYVRVTDGKTLVDVLFFVPGTSQEDAAAAKLGELRIARPMAKAAVSRKCMGALRDCPVIGEVEQYQPGGNDMSGLQSRILRQLAEVNGWLKYARNERRSARSLVKRGFVVEGAEGCFAATDEGKAMARRLA